ncbi:hypothetical protein HY772_07090 [Candidatus Woesearchaeota archaeon]|nr:hypothetical protein [Candidatus Woesearchaeota archaeon]
MEAIKRNSRLRRFILEHARQHYTPTERPVFFRRLWRQGIKDDLIPSLATLELIHAFFDQHYSEIETCRIEWERQTQQGMKLGDDLKTTLVVFTLKVEAFAIFTELDGRLVVK